MNRSNFRRLALFAVAAPLFLGLAACGKDEKAGGLSGDKIEAIAPPAGKVWSDVVTKTPEGGYLMGNPDAPIKLVEYGSLTCSHCMEYAEKSSAEMRDKFVASGRVSFEFRNFVRDAIDLTAAQLTQCGTPESFFPLTEQAFANQMAMMQAAQAAGEAAYKSAMEQPMQKRGAALAQMAGLTDFFAARGISKDQAATCLANTAAMEGLAKRTQEQGDELNITGTPTFFVNGAKLEVGRWEEMKVELEKLGAR